MMTPMQRQRLTDLMNSIEYRHKQAKRILIALCLLAIIALMMAAVTSCSSAPIESRPAIPAAMDRDARGRYILPVCPVCGAHPIDRWTGFHCVAGHRYETPNSRL